MNKEYIYIDGKVVVKDENKKAKRIDNCNNLEKILVQENVIETIENEFTLLEEQIEEQTNESKWEKIRIFLPLLTGVIIPILVIPGLTNLAGNIQIINTIFGTIKLTNFLVFITTPLTIFTGAFISTCLYDEYKRDIKNKQVRNHTLDYLRKRLEHEKEQLQQLENEKIKIEEECFGAVEIDDKQEINNLYSHINLQQECSYNGLEYYKYYHKYGKLPKKLEKRYNEFGQEIIKEYLEEKGPRLIKNR